MKLQRPDLRDTMREHEKANQEGGGTRSSVPAGERPPRRAYSPPQLVVYGTLSDLTQALGVLGRDGLAGSRPRT